MNRREYTTTDYTAVEVFVQDHVASTDEETERPAHAVSTAIKDGWRRLGQEIVQVVLPALLLALVIHLFLAQATVVYGRSMEPNLHERERLIIDKISYRLHPPQRNDIVVLDLPEMDEMLVKRIIGLPGETVEIRGGVVYVDGHALEERFPHDTFIHDTPPLNLGAFSYFVLGDNRGNSNDSRSFGSVSREAIVGRVWLRYWPLHQLMFF